MNTEDDAHFPTLKVQEAIDFAASTKLSHGSTKAETGAMRDEILNMLGIFHTKSTVGIPAREMGRYFGRC